MLLDGVLQEKGQLLENVFADPKGFGLDPSGESRPVVSRCSTLWLRPSDFRRHTCVSDCSCGSITPTTLLCIAGKYRYEMPGFRSGEAAVS
jgi:hypothetical protein